MSIERKSVMVDGRGRFIDGQVPIGAVFDVTQPFIGGYRANHNLTEWPRCLEMLGQTAGNGFFVALLGVKRIDPIATGPTAIGFDLIDQERRRGNVEIAFVVFFDVGYGELDRPVGFTRCR